MTNTTDDKSHSEQLIEICSAPATDDIRQHAAIHVLDWLGTILAARDTEAGQAIIRFAEAKQFASGNCFVCGHSALDAMGASFINGGLGNILELDDVHRASILHAGDTIIPAVLAIAQKQNTTLGKMLDAITQAYEFAIRLGVTAAGNGYSNWYNSGTCGIFGAAFGSGTVLALTPVQMKDCIGQAGMLASGIWQCRHEHTFSKQLASAHAASNGVAAALLGKQGFTGARFILEGEAGFFPTYYPQADLKAIDLEPVRDWYLSSVSIKPWPACRHTHPAIEAALALGARHSHTEVKSIRLNTYQAAIDFCDNMHPTTDHEARFSLQHCIAVAFVKGKPVIPDFGEIGRSDSTICELRKKISLHCDEKYQRRFPSGMGSSLFVTLDNGNEVQYSVDNAKGDPENPMDHQEIKIKFKNLANYAGITEQQQESLMNALILDKNAYHAGASDFYSQQLHLLNNTLVQIAAR